jgi:hypothetical protein
MSQINLKLPAPHPAQKLIDDCDTRFIVAVCGRRFGKTTSIPRKRIHKLLRGEQGAYFAPSYRMLQEFYRSTKSLLAPITTKVSKQEHRLEFIGGGSLTMWSLDNPDSVRGQKYHFADIDEAAIVKELEEAWNAVIRPTLTDFRGEAAFWSTPKGINYFHKLFTRGTDPEYPDWSSFQFPTSANPYIDASEIEAARMELPLDVYRQEYLAEFITGEGAVFRRIEENLTSDRTTPREHIGHNLVAGVDWGQVSDFTAISIVCENCLQEVELDRFNQLDWEFQRTRLLALMDKWNIKMTMVEENSIGSPNLEALQKNTLRSVKGFLTTASSKPPLIQSLALAFEQTEIKWLDIPVATAELQSYEAHRNEVTNRIQYAGAKGGHDDTVIARALARWAIEERRRSVWQFREFRF